jgi:hypothetical protein
MAVPAISLTVRPALSDALTATQLLDVLEHAIHGSHAEWLFFVNCAWVREEGTAIRSGWTHSR